MWNSSTNCHTRRLFPSQEFIKDNNVTRNGDPFPFVSFTCVLFTLDLSKHHRRRHTKLCYASLSLFLHRLFWVERYPYAYGNWYCYQIKALVFNVRSIVYLRVIFYDVTGSEGILHGDWSCEFNWKPCFGIAGRFVCYQAKMSAIYKNGQFRARLALWWSRSVNNFEIVIELSSRVWNHISYRATFSYKLYHP